MYHPVCMRSRARLFFPKNALRRAREIVSLNPVAQVAVSKMAEFGIVPPYEFVADGMGRNAGADLW